MSQVVNDKDARMGHSLWKWLQETIIKRGSPSEWMILRVHYCDEELPGCISAVVDVHNTTC
jgi:hypothetical protein